MPAKNWFDLDEDVATVIHAHVAGYSACGSRVTCDPPPTNTDRDFLVEVHSEMLKSFNVELELLGFAAESDLKYEAPNGFGFKSFRRGDLNLIVTDNEDFASRHRAATYVCTRLNIAQKPDRIALFQAVLYGRSWKV